MRKIAIITPVFNGKEFIGQCIDSVAAIVPGGYKVEHIVVDDGSTDGSFDEAKKMERPGLRVCGYEVNRGGSYARNFGVKQTTADYIFCLDADDAVFQRSVSTLADFLQEQSYDWVYGDFLRADENLRYMVGRDYYGYDFFDPAQVLTSMFSGEHFFQQNCLYKKTVFDAVGGFDEGIRGFEDFNLFTRFLLSGYMPHYLPGPLYVHRFHKGNISRLSGRENDPRIHRQDVKKLFLTLQPKIVEKLSVEQIRKIADYLDLTTGW